ncbi:hypothetical protein [Leptospira perdikensis]|nr:hypothetical protein [Leptospira perdikensis]
MNTFAFKDKSECERFHSGTFIFNSSFGEVIIVRNKSEDISYRVYPKSFVRSSVKWISPCVAEFKAIEINDDIFSPEFRKMLMNGSSKLYITETFSDGYSYKITEESSSKVNYGKVKFYTGSLPAK